MTAKYNFFLSSLPDDAHHALKPHLVNVALAQNDLIFDVRETIGEVHFPIDAVVSLVVPLAGGEVVETAMVGRDGVIGLGTALDTRVSLNRGVVEIGGHSLTCKIETLKDVLAKYPAMRTQFRSHEQVLFAQAQQSAACNATHDIESRLARWLLRAADLHGSHELPLTQEYIAEMLGVRRTSVSVVAHTLQMAGMVGYKRGHITLLDLDALRETACECYETIKLHYATLHRPSNAMTPPPGEHLYNACPQCAA
jgi:CRP-like cAMP-binding protein